MKKRLLMPMHLQFFAEQEQLGDEQDGMSTNQESSKPKESEQSSDEETNGGKTFTRDEVAKMLAAETSKAKQAWEKEYETRVEKERNEALELAKLSEKDRQKALDQKERDDFEKEKAEFRKEQLFVEKGKQLTAEGLPSDFASRIVGESAEDILADVKAFRTEWDKAVEAKVNERLASKNKTKVGSGSGQMTKAEIMSVKDDVERQRLIAQNRDLF